MYISNSGRQEYKTRKCSRQSLCRTFINCLYQLPNTDTFKLVPVCEQTRPLIENYLHFMEKNKSFLGMILHRLVPGSQLCTALLRYNLITVCLLLQLLVTAYTSRNIFLKCKIQGKKIEEYRSKSAYVLFFPFCFSFSIITLRMLLICHRPGTKNESTHSNKPF